ncbi:MAG: PTS glucose/sucrose transporter subunit IIB [Actinomycetaceae bacterium]|nr:PTS glucose/sucrose transporter subunit IIB [Actinomycetaceae bacterium]
MSQAEQLIAGLGGANNISELESCITRLRVEVVDEALVDDEQLKSAGAFDVIKTSRIIQVVIGPTADTVSDDLRALL